MRLHKNSHRQSSADFQAVFADHVRDPSLPAPEGIDGARLAVYTRLVRNNLKTFLDLCFSDSQVLIDSKNWQDWQNRFLIEARPESPFFNDIPSAFLAYLHCLPADDRPSENILYMMAFETDLLYAETAIQPKTVSVWHDQSKLQWATSAKLKHYPCDFVSTGLESIIEDAPVYVLTWRNRQNEVYYKAVGDADLLLLTHFQEHSTTFTELSQTLQTLTGNKEAEAWLRESVTDWVDAGVLLPLRG
ncbi:HvfC family RiPP maturation protein [Neisseria chenwenguii]|uniref:DUF2063 domain-containing protein n=1 Tax=Neisseria chenwenguii TaxID=1853278 RepID=A0A220S1R0_9NEIS|nr:putative DNA-binding domain-containing protein [Neisseria chenwenguii]ASK27298.1 DUF2063 domain-containing protein [Neisseria chenwenguii]ROV57027.1 DUF2063 domain-containing protein [Neisseria chenwenguii]